MRSRILVFLAALAIVATGQAQIDSSVSFAATDGLLIEYDFRSDGPMDPRSTPMVRVFGDGRLEVAVPWHRRNSGFYVGWLSPSELDRLLREIEQSRVPTMRPEDLRWQRDQAKSNAETIVLRSETETTRFSFALAGAKTMAQSSWRNLRADAAAVGKSIDAYASLWRVDRRLHALTQHPSLKKTADMPAAREEAR